MALEQSLHLEQQKKYDAGGGWGDERVSVCRMLEPLVISYSGIQGMQAFSGRALSRYLNQTMDGCVAVVGPAA